MTSPIPSFLSGGGSFFWGSGAVLGPGGSTLELSTIILERAIPLPELLPRRTTTDVGAVSRGRFGTTEPGPAVLALLALLPKGWGAYTVVVIRAEFLRFLRVICAAGNSRGIKVTKRAGMWRWGILFKSSLLDVGVSDMKGQSGRRVGLRGWANLTSGLSSNYEVEWWVDENSQETLNSTYLRHHQTPQLLCHLLLYNRLCCQLQWRNIVTLSLGTWHTLLFLFYICLF